MKNFIAIIMLLLCICARAEERKFSLIGEIRDRATNSYLPGVRYTVYDENNDSISGGSLDYYQSAGGGAYMRTSKLYVKVPRREATYTFVFAYEDFDTLRVEYKLDNIGRRELERKIGTYYMDRHREPIQLNEVVVETSKVKFYHNGDTLVYNADAFNLAEGSMLDALVQQLPGVELRDGGAIYVNGRFVESLLLDGKEFFKGNNQVMLDNLAAYTVNKIQVYEKQSDEARFVGDDDKQNKEFVMDVRLKKEYNSGWMINAEGGYGTNDRYLGRLFGMHYTAQKRFTLIANINNLGTNKRPTQDSAIDLDNLATKGRAKMTEVGFDYNIETENSKRKFAGNAYVKSESNDLETTTNRVNYMPGGDNYTYSRNFSNVKNLKVDTWHYFSNETEHHFFQVTPAYYYTRRENSSRSASALYNTEITAEQWQQTLKRLLNGDVSVQMRDSLINQSRTLNAGKSFSSHGQLGSKGTVRFDKSQDYISYRFQANLDHKHSHSEKQYLINYGDASIDGVAEQQRNVNRPDYHASWTAGATYCYVGSEKWRVSLSYDYYEEWKRTKSSLYTSRIKADATGRFDIEALEAMQGELDAANSYRSREHNSSHTFNPGLRLKPSNWSINMAVPMKVDVKNLHYRRGTVDASPKRTAFVIDGDVIRANWNDFTNPGEEERKGFGHNFYGGYSVKGVLPNLESMIEMTNDADPLNIYLGNPDLKTSYQHRIGIDFFTFSRSKMRQYMASVEGNATTNALVSGYSFNPTTGVRTFKTYNVNGNWNLRTKFSFYTILDAKQRWGTSVDVDYAYYKYADMIGSNDGSAPRLYDANTHQASLNASGSYNYARNSVLYFGCEARLTHADNPTAAGSTTVNVRPYLTVRGRIVGPLSVHSVLQMHNRMGYTDKALNNTTWVWNATISCSLGKHWTLMLDGYDILNQLSNVVTSVNSQGRSEVYYNTLPRYVMLRCQYTVNITPKKKIASVPKYFDF